MLIYIIHLADFDRSSRKCRICSCYVPKWTLCVIWRWSISKPFFKKISGNRNTFISFIYLLKLLFYFILGKDKSVVLWSIQDHISTLATDSGATKSPGSNGGKSPKTEDKVTESPKIKARGIFQGHQDTVEDVQFCPSRYHIMKMVFSSIFYYSHDTVWFTFTKWKFVMWNSAQEFCSVGDDSCLILWDARTGSSPVVKVTLIFIK